MEMSKHLKVALAMGSLALAPAVLTMAFPGGETSLPEPSGYRLIKTIPVGGDDWWDYAIVDSEARRVYVSHGTHVVVLDADKEVVVGDIPDPQGVHGIAIASDLAAASRATAARTP